MGDSLQAAVRRVVVLGTGGTIAGRAATAGDNVGYTAGQVGVADLLAGIDAPAGVELVAEQVAQLDSKDMSFAVWRDLALRCAHWLAQPDVAGVVITHGTDTLEETAYFLHAVLAPRKPVVITCAMRPATSLMADGPQNVRDAVAVAATPGLAGVAVVCAGTVHSALSVQKTHTYRLDAFSSGEAGALGFVEEGVLRSTRNWPVAPTDSASPAMNSIAEAVRWPRVEVVTSLAGATGALIDLLVRERQSGADDAVQGIVLAATGNGTLHHALEAAALRARAAGIAVRRATRCVYGRILPKAGDALQDAGALSPVKARVALVLDLLAQTPRAP